MGIDSGREFRRLCRSSSVPNGYSYGIRHLQAVLKALRAGYDIALGAWEKGHDNRPADGHSVYTQPQKHTTVTSKASRAVQKGKSPWL
jgi:hypothetical protein